MWETVGFLLSMAMGLIVICGLLNAVAVVALLIFLLIVWRQLLFPVNDNHNYR